MRLKQRVKESEVKMVNIRKEKNGKILYNNLRMKAMSRFSEKKYKLMSLSAKK
jgi:hypothetical protein